MENFLTLVRNIKVNKLKTNKNLKKICSFLTNNGYQKMMNKIAIIFLNEIILNKFVYFYFFFIHLPSLIQIHYSNEKNSIIGSSLSYDYLLCR